MSFAFVLGADSNIDDEAKLCTRSLRYHHPEAPIYVGVPPDEKISTEIEDHATEIFKVSTPLSNYPISHKVATLATIQKQTDVENYVLLDADTVLVDEFLLPDFSGVAACPEPYVANHWTKRPYKDWKDVASTYGFEVPSNRIRAPMNNRKMIPYYNSGVVITNNNDFADRWLDLTINLYEDDIPEKKFSDQVALSLLGFRDNIKKLPIIYNWPVDAHVPCLTNALIIHYHRPLWMLTAFDKRHLLRKLDATEDLPYGYNDIRFIWYLIRMVVNHALCINGSSHGNFVWASKDSVLKRLKQFFKEEY